MPYVPPARRRFGVEGMSQEEICKRLDAKIEELEKYLKTHNQFITGIVLETLKEIKGKNA